MKRTRNFHVPLTDSQYVKLSREAKRLGRPATELAREAISEWLRRQRKQRIAEDIAAYAEEFAGTSFDLDEGLEAAAYEHFNDLEEESGR